MRRQGAKDLTSAIAIAEALVDLQSSTAQETDKSKFRPKVRKFEKKPFKKKEVTRKSFAGKHREEKTQAESRQAGTSTKSFGCYICASPHMAQECLKRVALVTKGDIDSKPASRVNPLQLLGAF